MGKFVIFETEGGFKGHFTLAACEFEQMTFDVRQQSAFE
jgi:hypothetical protein